jgi:hypothetical protein
MHCTLFALLQHAARDELLQTVHFIYFTNQYAMNGASVHQAISNALAQSALGDIQIESAIDAWNRWMLVGPPNWRQYAKRTGSFNTTYHFHEFGYLWRNDRKFVDITIATLHDTPTVRVDKMKYDLQQRAVQSLDGPSNTVRVFVPHTDHEPGSLFCRQVNEHAVAVYKSKKQMTRHWHIFDEDVVL